MSIFDLLALIAENLGRRKARVALTAIGVIIGTAAVVVLVSLGAGLQKNATEQIGNIGDLTIINVSPIFGEGDGPIIARPGGPGGPGVKKLITDATLRDFAALPNVTAVIPRDWLQTSYIMRAGRLEGYGSLVGVGIEDLSALGLTAVGGELKLAKSTVIIGSQVPLQFYDPRPRPGAEPPPPPDLLGQQLKLTLFKSSSDGVEIRKTIILTVVGVIAESGTDADWSIYMPLTDVTAFNEWGLGKRIDRNRDGYNEVIVKVNNVNNVLDVAEQISTMEYQAFTLQSYVQGINNLYVALQVVFGSVGAIALLVAAIGIANTMAMAILERTREIGLMKAVGATNRNVLSVFLGEAAGIGFLGGVGGVTLGWSAGQIVNVVALAYLTAQAVQNGGPPPTSAVLTPPWLMPFSVLFATLIGLLSGLYPALRAATLVPVTALKYE